MSEIEYIIIVIAILLIYIIYQNYVKDTKYTKNIRSLALAVENLNREFYELQKRVEKYSQELEITSSMTSSGDDVDGKIQKSISELSVPLAQSLEEVEKSLELFEEYKSSTSRRLSMLEDGMKSFSMPSSINSMDDDKILTLYKQGVSVETIAKELHLAKPEVEFTLKLNQMR